MRGSQCKLFLMFRLLAGRFLAFVCFVLDRRGELCIAVRASEYKDWRFCLLRTKHTTLDVVRAFLLFYKGCTATLTSPSLEREYMSRRSFKCRRGYIGGSLEEVELWLELRHVLMCNRHVFAVGKSMLQQGHAYISTGIRFCSESLRLHSFRII